jgi:hypothetical protein
MGRLVVAKRDVPVEIQLLTDFPDPDRDRYATGALLPGPDATLAGPTFAEWLDASSGGGNATDPEWSFAAS